MLSALSRLEDSAARAAGDQLPRGAPGLPERGVDDFRIVRIENEISDTGGVVAIEKLSPVLAAVGRFVDAALGAWAKHVPQRADVDDVRIDRIHANARDLPRIRKPEGDPRLSAVVGSPDPVAVRDVAANRILTTAHVYDVWIGFADADSADRPTEVFVRDGGPGNSAIGRLKDA